ncbi:MAG TPA: hypothetical protein VFR81_12375 [Longimicrobium sp.]|nr:hypothetical protein [Longimicrobium sp.]
MTLTSCRDCGAVLPAHAHACPSCGASTAPAALAYRPAPPRPPEPERPWWRTGAGWGTAAGWAAVVAVCVLAGLFVLRLSGEADRKAAAEAEEAREVEHMLEVDAWTRDTSFNAAVPGGARRPVPTSDAAKRMWVMSRMLVDRRVREREVEERHGVRNGRLPKAFDTPHYRANARSYPEVGRYLEGRAAAFAEIEKTSAAWMEERIAALARESGLPAPEIRDLFPRGFAGAAPGEERTIAALLEMHRHLVRVDPRVRSAGGNLLTSEREDDLRRLHALEVKIEEAAAARIQGKTRKSAEDVAAMVQASGGRMQIVPARATIERV